ncbi:MAG: ribokinase [Isosphaeraceae bacterium]
MPRVVVLGSSGYDLTIRLPRLPRAGETLLGGELHTGPGGKGANAAIAARRAGAEVTFLTAFGDDDFGRQIREHDRREGLDLSYAKTVKGRPNQVALIFVGEDGQNLIGVAPGASESLTPEDIDALPDSAFPAGGVLLACLEIPLATVARGLRRARAAGMTTILNPAPADPALMFEDAPSGSKAGLLSTVDVLTPNQEEALELAGLGRSGREPMRAAAALFRRTGAGSVVITLGDDGAFVLDRDGNELLIPPHRVEVVDTVGAGDAYNGALAVALAEGRPLIEAAKWAGAAGALAVTRTGAQGALPHRVDIDSLIAQALD